MKPLISIIIPFYQKKNYLEQTIKSIAKQSQKNFEIIENGDYVECAVSGKRIDIEKLNYWNVDLQEPYYSYVEASKKKEELQKN